MTKKLISILFVMVYLPSVAYAQTYRCQSSNGSMSFQDYPCQKGATGSKINQPRYYSHKVENQSQGYLPSVEPSSKTAPLTASEKARYPYAREGDVAELKAANEELQAKMKRMKAENPDWQHDQTWTRLNDESEALNKSIQK